MDCNIDLVLIRYFIVLFGLVYMHKYLVPQVIWFVCLHMYLLCEFI
jgi:hypothetical protein